MRYKKQLPVFQPAEAHSAKSAGDGGQDRTLDREAGQNPGCADGCCAPLANEGVAVEPPARWPEPGDGSGCGDECCAPSGEGAAEFIEAPARSAGDEEHDDLERTVVRVTGMDCASCAATVERSVLRVEGVQRATVNFAAGRLDAAHEPGVKTAEIEQAIQKAGYGVERP